jgi:predicted RND superfamily exporter protein
MIKQLFEGIAHTIIRKPRLVAVLVMAIFCIGLFGMTMLSMQTGWKTYVDQDSPKGVNQAIYEKDYQADAIILIIEAGDPLSPEVLDYIAGLQRISGSSNILRAPGVLLMRLKAPMVGNSPHPVPMRIALSVRFPRASGHRPFHLMC